MTKEKKYEYLFSLMKKYVFTNINEYIYEKENLEKNNKIEFLDFFNWIKSLFGYHQINKKNQPQLKDFWQEINKRNYEEKIAIMELNPEIAYFLSEKEIKKYVNNAIKSKDNWWMYICTFSKYYVDFKYDDLISNKSLQQFGRYVLNNEYIKEKRKDELKNKLDNFSLQNLGALNGTYFSWDELIKLIHSIGVVVSEYILNLAATNGWITSQAIIDWLSKENNKDVNKLKNDNIFKKQLYKIHQNNINKASTKSSNFKFVITKEEEENFFKNINFIYEIFYIPKEIKSKSIMNFLFQQESRDINYDTTKVPDNYFFHFRTILLINYHLLESYMKWIVDNNQKIKLTKSPAIFPKINDLILNFLDEKNAHICGFISLTLLRDIILYLWPEKRESFKKMNYFQVISECAQDINKDEITWTAEILFAPSTYFFNIRNKIVHFDKVEKLDAYIVISFALELLKVKK